MGEPTPLGQALTDLADADPDRPAVTDATGTLTRTQLETGANRLAHAYAELGVGPGSMVTVALPNSAEFYLAVFALWKLGATPQLVSPVLPARERDAILALAEPMLVVGVDPADVPEHHAVPMGFTPDTGASAEPIVPDRISPSWKAPTSGGSTGRPKVIVSAQPGELDIEATAAVLGQHDGERQLVCGPLYHNAPFNFSFYGLLAGQHLVVLPKFDTVAALTAIRDHRITWIGLVPTMMSRILRELDRAPQQYDIGSLTAVWHGAAPCPAWLKRAWIDLVGPDHLHEMYGTSEGQMMTHITGAQWLDHPGSVGRPLWGRVRILDADGRDVPSGRDGDLVVRPDNDKPTYRYVGADAHIADGWEYVGDIGRLDADGYLYISDRRTDLIVTGGANVYPAEVEAALTEHPDIRAAIVVGVSDDDLGRRVHAVIETDSPPDPAALRTFLAERLVRYKIPRDFTLTDRPLRNDAGKARRAEWRTRIEQSAA